MRNKQKISISIIYLTENNMHKKGHAEFSLARCQRVL